MLGEGFRMTTKHDSFDASPHGFYVRSPHGMRNHSVKLVILFIDESSEYGSEVYTDLWLEDYTRFAALNNQLPGIIAVGHVANSNDTTWSRISPVGFDRIYDFGFPRGPIILRQVHRPPRTIFGTTELGVLSAAILSSGLSYAEVEVRIDVSGSMDRRAIEPSIDEWYARNMDGLVSDRSQINELLFPSERWVKEALDAIGA